MQYGEYPLVFGDSARANWIRLSLESLAAGAKLIDVGAGPQRYRSYCTHLEYISQDFCKYDGQGDGVGYQNENWDTAATDIVSDICGIPVKDGEFDAALCISVLEHVPNPIAALREIGRILRPGGQLILTAPFSNITHQAPYHFYTGFPRYFYEEHLKEDFQIDQIQPNGDLYAFMNTFLHYTLSFSDKYSKAVFEPAEAEALQVVMRALDRLSQQQTNSEDIMNFGYQINATRL